MQVSDQITRKSASNLALAFVLLPRSKREGMAALYAFCREVDDIADEEGQPMATRAAALQEWREDVRLACNGGNPKLPVNQELQPHIARHRLPFSHFDELIKGVEMDLETNRYKTMEDLEAYCYRVASVVGLLSIEIFGYRNPVCREYAVHLGKALQLTNILRDVRNDAERGRIYLPLDQLQSFGVTQEEILEGRFSPRYSQLAAHTAARAREHYTRAFTLLPAEERRSMAAAEVMGSVYWRLLQKLEKRQFNVFDYEETRLNKCQKISLILRTWFRIWSGRLVPNYGVG